MPGKDAPQALDDGVIPGNLEDVPSLPVVDTPRRGSVKDRANALNAGNSRIGPRLSTGKTLEFEGGGRASNADAQFNASITRQISRVEYENNVQKSKSDADSFGVRGSDTECSKKALWLHLQQLIDSSAADAAQILAVQARQLADGSLADVRETALWRFAASFGHAPLAKKVEFVQHVYGGFAAMPSEDKAEALLLADCMARAAGLIDAKIVPSNGIPGEQLQVLQVAGAVLAEQARLRELPEDDRRTLRKTYEEEEEESKVWQDSFEEAPPSSDQGAISIGAAVHNGDAHALDAFASALNRSVSLPLAELPRFQELLVMPSVEMARILAMQAKHLAEHTAEFRHSPLLVLASEFGSATTATQVRFLRHFHDGFAEVPRDEKVDALRLAVCMARSAGLASDQGTPLLTYDDQLQALGDAGTLLAEEARLHTLVSILRKRPSFAEESRVFEEQLRLSLDGVSAQVADGDGASSVLEYVPWEVLDLVHQSKNFFGIARFLTQLHTHAHSAVGALQSSSQAPSVLADVSSSGPEAKVAAEKRLARQEEAKEKRRSRAESRGFLRASLAGAEEPRRSYIGTPIVGGVTSELCFPASQPLGYKRSSIASRHSTQAPVRLLPDESEADALSPDEVTMPEVSVPGEERVARWTAGMSHDLCGKGQEEQFDGLAPLLNQFSAVSQAVEHLNANPHLCPLGQCVVWSEKKQRYFLLYVQETRQKAFSTFVFEEKQEQEEEGKEDQEEDVEEEKEEEEQEEEVDERQRAWIEELEDADSDDSDYDIEGLFRKMPAEARDDREVVLAAIGRSGKNVVHASEALKADREVILSAVASSGLMLEHAAEALKDDKEVVLAALRNEGLALRHAGEAPRSDKDVVLEAVQLNGRSLEFASEALKDDSQVVFAALTQLEVPDITADSSRLDMGRAAVRQSGDLLVCFPRAVQEDREILLEAVKRKGMALEIAPANLRDDKGLVMAAVEQDGNALQFAGDSMRSDRDVVLAAVRDNFRALQFADDSLKEDNEVVTAAIQQNMDFM